MELMQLEMFVAVVEERSFQLAAERVFRTQPAVSIGLTKLEDEIGAPLLDRSRRQSGRLTPRGVMLYEYAARILRLRSDMISALKKQDSGSTGILRVGVTWEVSLDLIHPVTKQFNARYPSIRVEVLCDQADSLMRDLHVRRADIVVLSGRPKATPGDGRFIVTRLPSSKPQRTFWIARRMHGQSPFAAAFEQELRGQVENARRARSSKVLQVRSLALGQRTSLKPEIVPDCLIEHAFSARPKLRRS